MLETDPLDLKLDTDGDVLIDSSGLHFISGIEGVAQLCLIAVRLFLGEWFLDRGRGMPWFQEILGEKYDQGLLHSRLTAVLVGVPGVLRTTSIASVREGRAIRVTWVVQTIFGESTGEAAVGDSDA